MRRHYKFLIFLLLLAIVSGQLLARMSWVGRTVVSYIGAYKGYHFLTVWWEGALSVLLIWLLFLYLQQLVFQKLDHTIAVVFQFLAILIAGVGLYATYRDFRHDLAHRWLNEPFHLGAYLFWIGWMSISAYCLLINRHSRVRAEL